MKVKEDHENYSENVELLKNQLKKNRDSENIKAQIKNMLKQLENFRVGTTNSYQVLNMKRSKIDNINEISAQLLIEFLQLQANHDISEDTNELAVNGPSTCSGCYPEEKRSLRPRSVRLAHADF